MLDLIEVLRTQFTDEEIGDMNPWQAQDEYGYILQERIEK